MGSQHTRSDPIYATLRRAIIEQVLLPGARLPEDQVGETFSVSRTVVRAALMRLSSEGLVDMRPYRGAAVASPTIDEARDVFELRRCLEREVVNRLCQRISKDAIDALEAHLREEERVLRNGGAGSIRLSGEFHILLAELTGSPILTRYVSETVSRSSLILASHVHFNSTHCGLNEHVKLVAALRDGDTQAAKKLIETHLTAIRDHLLIHGQSKAGNVGAVLSRYLKAAS